MDLMILKKKIDGYRAGNGSIKNVSPELLLELRQTWENFTGSQEQFRAELGMKTGTLRKLLVESKKLNHVLGSAGAMGVALGESEGGSNDLGHDATQAEEEGQARHMLELAFDHGDKVIRFPNVDTLIDFLRKTA